MSGLNHLTRCNGHCGHVTNTENQLSYPTNNDRQQTMNSVHMEIYKKPYLKFVMGLFLALITSAQLVHQSAQANTTAKNRNDVYQILSNLNSNLALTELDIWVNHKSQSPSVNIGDKVYFTMKSSEPVFYTLIHVDSKGNAALVKPKTNGSAHAGSDYLVYPPLVGGCREYELNENCFDLTNRLVQTDPIGQDAVYLLASKKAIPFEVLGMNESEDLKFLGKELAKIEELVQVLNSQSNNNAMAVIKYTYAVESEDTQYSTRAISKKVNKVAVSSMALAAR